MLELYIVLLEWQFNYIFDKVWLTLSLQLNTTHWGIS